MSAPKRMLLLTFKIAVKIILLGFFICFIALLHKEAHLGYLQSDKIYRYYDDIALCQFDLPPSTSWYEWKKLNDQIFLFSAFIETAADKHTILIIGISSIRRAHHFCRIWSADLETQIVIEATEQRYLSIHKKKFLTWTYKCEFGVNEIPQPGFVSVVESKCQTPSFHLVLQNSFHPSASNHVPIKMSDDKNKVNFTACLSPLNNNYNSHQQLIEWIEVNKIFGVERFVVYDYSSSDDVRRVLKHYEDEGFLHIVPWKIPVRVVGDEEIHYFGQTTALNDCFYRSKNFSRFVINVDVDEIMVPRKSSTYMEMLQLMYQSTSVVDGETKVLKSETMESSCHIVRSSFFRMDKSRDFFVKNLSNPVIDNIKEDIFRFDARTLWVTKREEEIFIPGARSKLIVGCKHKLWLDVHTLYLEAPAINVPEDDCLLHHYRSVIINGPNAGTVDDEHMHKFAPAIISRLKLIYDKMKLFHPILTTPSDRNFAKLLNYSKNQRTK